MWEMAYSKGCYHRLKKYYFLMERKLYLLCDISWFPFSFLSSVINCKYCLRKIDHSVIRAINTVYTLSSSDWKSQSDYIHVLWRFSFIFSLLSEDTNKMLGFSNKLRIRACWIFRRKRLFKYLCIYNYFYYFADLQRRRLTTSGSMVYNLINPFLSDSMFKPPHYSSVMSSEYSTSRLLSLSWKIFPMGFDL